MALFAPMRLHSISRAVLRIDVLREVFMRVADLLRQKANVVRSVDEHMTVGHAIRLMAAHNVGALLVFEQENTPLEMDSGGTALLGIVSEREIMISLAKYGEPVLGYKVADIMVTDVPALLPADSIQHAMAVMTHAKVRHLPVIDHGKLAGLISIGDVVKSRLEEKIEENAVLQDMARLSSLLSA
jgi:CBS domain-containing protein